MRTRNIQNSSVDELVDRFKEIALGQDHAIRTDDNAKFRALFREMEAVEAALKSHAGDQRRALLELYDDPNSQVRLSAAKATLAVAPEAARRLLRAIADSNDNPQAGDAGMCLVTLDRGIFRPT
jgi:HEAT repeat protein